MINSQKAIQKQDKQIPEAESEEQHGLLELDPMPELTLSTPESTSTHLPWALGNGQPYARVDLYPMQELTLSLSQGQWIWPHAVLWSISALILATRFGSGWASDPQKNSEMLFEKVLDVLF
jgi:hypothetical protein